MDRRPAVHGIIVGGTERRGSRRKGRQQHPKEDDCRLSDASHGSAICGVKIDLSEQCGTISRKMSGGKVFGRGDVLRLDMEQTRVLLSADRNLFVATRN